MGVLLAARSYDLVWWLTAGLLSVAVVFTHVALERFLGPRSRHLGAHAIADDDPLMLAALEKAKRTWPDFVALFPEHPHDSIVKFRLTTKDGAIENVWGDLVALDGGVAEVYLRTPPVGEVDLPDRHMTIPVRSIVDWQIAMSDGSLRGGFTQQATFKIVEREAGVLPAEYAEQLRRYRDL